MSDPTYNRDIIRSNGVWEIAYIISQMLDDNAPIGWSKYIPLAEEVVNKAKKL